MKDANLTYQVAVKEFHYDGDREVRIAERFYRDGRPATCPRSSANHVSIAAKCRVYHAEVQKLVSWRVCRETQSGLAFPGASLQDGDIQTFIQALTAVGIDLDVGRMDIV